MSVLDIYNFRLFSPDYPPVFLVTFQNTKWEGYQNISASANWLVLVSHAFALHYAYLQSHSFFSFGSTWSWFPSLSILCFLSFLSCLALVKLKAFSAIRSESPWLFSETIFPSKAFNTVQKLVVS